MVSWHITAKETKISWRKAKETRKKKEETVWKEVVEMDSHFADPGVWSPKELMSVQKVKY